MTLYPIGYGTELVTLEELIAREMGNGMLPEAKRRHTALIVDRGGELGIGDGWRPTPSNTSEASKKGQSFHQTQTFADGSKGWVAIDFVCRNPSGGKHVAPVTGVIPVQGTKESRVWGIHANCGAPGESGWEPWHGQPIELDGWQTWVNAGRPMIQQNYPLPGGQPAPKKGVIDMYVIAVSRDGWPGPVDLVVDSANTRWNRDGNTSSLDKVAGVPRLEVDKPQTLGLLRDRPGIGDCPFEILPDYFDAELAAAW